jgi:hypothetical protein
VRIGFANRSIRARFARAGRSSVAIARDRRATIDASGASRARSIGRAVTARRARNDGDGAKE